MDVVRADEIIKYISIMKNTLLILAIALATVSSAQTLNDILDELYVPSDSTELSIPLLLTMVPQNGTPYEVLVIKENDVDPDGIYSVSLPTSETNDLTLYASFIGSDTLKLPLFEKGVYTIACLDKAGDKVGENTTILVNENFIQGVLETEYATKRNGLVVSTKPLRIGRDRAEYVSFN